MSGVAPVTTPEAGDPRGPGRPGTGTDQENGRAQDSPGSRMDAPDRLDRALTVTTAKSWLALGAILAILTAVAVWSVTGELATYVEAEGIILSRGGIVADVPSPRAGTLTKVHVEVGNRIEAGATVAELYDLEVTQRHRDAVATLEERLRALADHRRYMGAQLTLLDANIAAQRARLDTLRTVGQRLLDDATERLENARALAADQVVSHAVVETAEDDVNSARRNLFDLMTRSGEIEDEALGRRAQLQETLLAAEAERDAARRRVDELVAIMEEWKIRSPVAGRVTEVRGRVGSVLAVGESVIGVESGVAGLEVRVFVSPVHGKRIEAGMPALVSPSTARREEFGMMRGTVAELSQFPASLEGIVSLLQNEDLASSFTENGPPYPGRVALLPDSTAASRVAWTSSRGATVEITPGTLATVEIQVARQAPVALVLPWIREAFAM